MVRSGSRDYMRPVHEGAISSITLNLRPGGSGGWGILKTPTFFGNSGKKAARSAAVFCIASHASISHFSRKFQHKIISGQVTRSRQVTLPHFFKFRQ